VVGIKAKSNGILKKLVPEVKTTELVQQMITSNKSQLEGAKQIASEIHQLNKLAQQNAALSEETAVNSEELTEQAKLLQKAITLFKTK